MNLLRELYVRFMVWLGAAPPPGYEWLLQVNKEEQLSSALTPSPDSAPNGDSYKYRVIYAWSRILALIGLAVLILSISYTYISSEWRAKHLDNGLSLAAAGPCLHPEISLTMPRRVMAQNDSEAVTVILSDTVECHVDVRISAPNFDISPLESTRTITLSPGVRSELSWIIVPKEMGTHRISINANFENRTIGVVVTNTLGLTAQQAQLLSYLGMFFGPALTFPWLYDTWQKHKKEKQERDKEEQEAKLTELERKVEKLKTKQRAKK